MSRAPSYAEAIAVCLRRLEPGAAPPSAAELARVERRGLAAGPAAVEIQGARIEAAMPGLLERLAGVMPDAEPPPPVAPPAMPALSRDLPGPRDPFHCQACGTLGTISAPDGERCKDRSILRAWREHDEADRPTEVLVVLCDPCARRIVGPHPRLYGEVLRHEPAPGLMTLCLDCAHRDGVRCASPDAAANGGPGIRIKAHPARMHIKSSRRSESGMYLYYRAAPEACTGRVAPVEPLRPEPRPAPPPSDPEPFTVKGPGVHQRSLFS